MKTLKLTFLLALLFLPLSLETQASPLCDRHPIYCQIIKNKPRIDRKYAMRLSNAIYISTRRYGIPSRIYTAILRQESAYKVDAVNCKEGFEKGTKRITTVCADYGIAQVNYINIRAYGFDKERLLTDLEYSVDAGAMVLAWFYREFQAQEYDWWVRYNVGVRPKHKLKRNWKTYKRHVSRFL